MQVGFLGSPPDLREFRHHLAAVTSQLNLRRTLHLPPIHSKMFKTAVIAAALVAAETVLGQSEWDGTGCVMDADTELMKCLGNYA